MPTLAADSFDAIVTDPPYGLSFMGKHWDHGVPGVGFWTQAIRVMRPGSYLLAFGGTRTYHRLGVAIEDAGFEVQDCLCWLYGSGFPKHKSKLKPAWEPIIMARKPAPKATLLNIDACRVSIDPLADASQLRVMNRSKREDVDGWGMSTVEGDTPQVVHPEGRWPANVLLDEEAATVLDEQSGTLGTPGNKNPTRIGHGNNVRFGNAVEAVDASRFNLGDSGGASRFFYVAKASRSERNAGLEGFPPVRVYGDGSGQMEINSPERKAAAGRGYGDNHVSQNHHPTVKPIALMRWLVKLVTPANGLVLDPFCGSGTTGIAAIQEGFRFVGIEKEPEYAEIARARIASTPPSLFGEVA